MTDSLHSPSPCHPFGLCSHIGQPGASEGSVWVGLSPDGTLHTFMDGPFINHLLHSLR